MQHPFTNTMYFYIKLWITITELSNLKYLFSLISSDFSYEWQNSVLMVKSFLRCHILHLAKNSKVQLTQRWGFYLFSWSLSWMSSSGWDQWFPNLGRHQNHLRGSLNLTAGIYPGVSDSVAFLTSSLQMLMPLVWGPHFNNLQFLWSSMSVSSHPSSVCLERGGNTTRYCTGKLEVGITKATLVLSGQSQ